MGSPHRKDNSFVSLTHLFAVPPSLLRPSNHQSDDNDAFSFAQCLGLLRMTFHFVRPIRLSALDFLAQCVVPPTRDLATRIAADVHHHLENSVCRRENATVFSVMICLTD